ncbi:hypothetical protein C8R47DRAFT_992530 [Mycena vitilis]|nr:hypothetical protein C8R47DRAFT_992530 [Mycena vitilis]
MPECTGNLECCSAPDCSAVLNHGCVGLAEYRCVDQACFGEVMRCSQCIVASHAALPTHFKWDGRRFLRSRTGLRELGLRVQLGHPPGVVCQFKYPARNDFVLYDISGVHELALDFCGCLPRVEPRVQLMRACWWPATVIKPNTCATFAALRLFHALNCLGKLSAYDFLRGLEKITNNDGLNKPPDRRKPFMTIMREYRETKRMKRAARGHDESGVQGTAQGETALKCRACPQPGWNLPDNWENINPLYQYIYILFLAQDANFRLINRNVSSEAADPILGDGVGYFARREGEDGYKAHIAKHVDDQEISRCSGFQAMFLANLKRAKGLRTTGVGGVTCSRHNMWMPNGIGDLQVGERYCNIDYLLAVIMFVFGMAWLVVSYDIACQYRIKFWERISKMPVSIRPTLREDQVWWKVPNFHLPPHKRPCHSPYSFHWMYGAGMTHGEGVEQNWAASNGAAGSMKLMGPGSRQATLEDIFGNHNYDRILAMHRVLPKRLAVNIKEGMRHKVAFDAFSGALEALKPEEVAEWKESVLKWEAVQHLTAEGSPFEVAEEVSTMRDIQLRLASQELICTDDGVEIEREHSPLTFISTGLDLEDTQRLLEMDVAALKDPTASQKLAFTKRRTALLKRIHKFRQMQAIYMPVVRNALTNAQKQVFDGNGEQLPEVTRLFMPSEIQSKTVRLNVCVIGLPDVERQLRRGEASEALEAVRQGLRTRTMTNRFRLRNWTGQGMMTKGQGILRQVNIKISIAKVRYRYARVALLALEGHGEWEAQLRVLNDDDGGIARAAGVATGEGAHTLSWIWYSAGLTATDESDPRFYDALRVEWCKAYARTRRYTEEVRILREEMRRTVAFGYTASAVWDELARGELSNASPELTEGRRAYAAEHADTELQRCAQLTAKWGGILARADAFLEGSVEDIGPVTVEMELGDELDAEEEEARLEGEEEGEEA